MRGLQERSDTTTRADERRGNYARKRRARQRRDAILAPAFRYIALARRRRRECVLNNGKRRRAPLTFVTTANWHEGFGFDGISFGTHRNPQTRSGSCTARRGDALRPFAGGFRAKSDAV